MFKWHFFLLSGVLLSMPPMSMAARSIESTKPPHPLTSIEIAAKIIKKSLKNSHVVVYGVCFWLKTKTGLPKVVPGPAVTQFLPDLVVTVSNNPGENPWDEANALYENKVALESSQLGFQALMGWPLGFGDGSGQMSSQHIFEDRTRIVSVIGSPAAAFKIEGITHRAETTPLKLYYSSLLDAFNERTQAGEIAYMASHPSLFINHEIGTNFNTWGPEIPRLMRVTQPSRFRASVVAALHAVDIVTNEGAHIKQSTNNACGPHCVVANAIFDAKQKHLIWQEVYPKNRNIRPGSTSTLGDKEDEKSNGNYIFVLWRQYKGCVKQEGKFLSGPSVGKPKKR